MCAVHLTAVAAPANPTPAPPKSTTTPVHGEFDPAAGLYWIANYNPARSPEKFPFVHEVRYSANRLLAEHLSGSLRRQPVEKVLAGLRSQQIPPDGQPSWARGGFRWWAEDAGTPRFDANGTFFTLLPLIVLWHERDALTAPERTTLREIFATAYPFVVARSHPGGIFYPNADYGDRLAAWLLAEILGKTDDLPQILRNLDDGLASLETDHWGWGEHLSEVYTEHVMIPQFLVTVALGQNLPTATLDRAKRLGNELARLSAFYQGGAHVPVIRSYARSEPPKRFLPPLTARLARDAALAPINHPIVGSSPWVVSAGWAHLFPRWAARRDTSWLQPAVNRPTDLTIPSFGGVVATAYVTPAWRIGALSHYPLMPGAGVALSHQDFPVVFWRQAGDYGFLRWQTRIGEKTYTQPERDRGPDERAGLAPDVTPSIIGRTYTLQRGGDVLIVRLMPQFDRRWDALSDGWRLLAHSLKPLPSPSLSPDKTWSQLVLPYPEGPVGLVLAVPDRQVETTLETDGANATWLWTLPRDRFPKTEQILVWGYSAGGEVKSAPTFTTVSTLPALPRSGEQRVRDLDWTWPGTTWRVRIDPLADNPLTLIETPITPKH
jgi:hypothetical protein